MEQLTKATRESVVIGNYELKILYPELYIDHSTKKTTGLRQACDDLAVDCKRYTVLKCHVANYNLHCCQPRAKCPYIYKVNLGTGEKPYLNAKLIGTNAKTYH